MGRPVKIAVSEFWSRALILGLLQESSGVSMDEGGWIEVYFGHLMKERSYEASLTKATFLGKKQIKQDVLIISMVWDGDTRKYCDFKPSPVTIFPNCKNYPIE